MSNKTAKASVEPVRQRTQYSCMSASMAMCLRALGHEVTEDEVNKVMGARPMAGASWEQALACAQHYGCRATLTMPSTVEQLKVWTDMGIPVMIAWNPEGRPWSHASVVFDVDDDLNVHVADPNIPNPKETVRIVSEDDFYHKWFEQASDYLVRRPACAIEREITMTGAQIAPRIAAAKGDIDMADAWFRKNGVPMSKNGSRLAVLDDVKTAAKANFGAWQADVPDSEDPNTPNGKALLAFWNWTRGELIEAVELEPALGMAAWDLGYQGRKLSFAPGLELLAKILHVQVKQEHADGVLARRRVDEAEKRKNGTLTSKTAKITRDNLLDFLFNSMEHISSDEDAIEALIQWGADNDFATALVTAWEKERPDLKRPRPGEFAQEVQGAAAEELLDRIMKKFHVRYAKAKGGIKPTETENAVRDPYSRARAEQQGGGGQGRHHNKGDFERGHKRNPKHKNQEKEAVERLASRFLREAVSSRLAVSYRRIRKGEEVMFFMNPPVSDPNSLGRDVKGHKGIVLSVGEKFTMVGPDEMAPVYTVEMQDGTVYEEVPFYFFEKMPPSRDPIDSALKIVIKTLKGLKLKRVNSLQRGGRSLKAEFGAAIPIATVRDLLRRNPDISGKDDTWNLPIRTGENKWTKYRIQLTEGFPQENFDNLEIYFWGQA